MLLSVKNSLRRKCEKVRCRHATASSFVAEVPGEVFAHFHVFAVKRHIGNAKLVVRPAEMNSL
jgi:hypothetical protein